MKYITDKWTQKGLLSLEKLTIKLKLDTPSFLPEISKIIVDRQKTRYQIRIQMNVRPALCLRP